MNRFLTIFFLLVSSAQAFSQAYGNFNQLRLLQITKAADTAAISANQGRVWYDFVSDKFRGNVNGVNVTLAPVDAGAVATASNGLEIVGDDVRMGGNPITANTELAVEPGIQLSAELQTDGVGGYGRFWIGNNSTGDDWFDIDPSSNFYSINSESLSLNIESDLEIFATSPTVDINGSTDLSLRGVITSRNKHFFTTDATNAGLNVGSVAGNPSTLSNFDIWGNSSTNNLMTRINGISGLIPFADVVGVATTRIPFYNGTTGRLSSNSGFTFSGGTFTTPTVVSTGRGTFTATSTLAGLNPGSLAGNPSSLSDGDLWLNTTLNELKTRLNGITRTIVNTDNPQLINGVPFSLGNNGGLLSFESDYTYNSSTNTLDVDRVTLQPSASLSGINVGGLAGDPSGLTNGDLWYNSTSNSLRARINGVSVSLGSSGIGGSISSTQVAYGSGANTITGEGSFTYDGTNDAFTVAGLTIDDQTISAGTVNVQATALNVGSSLGTPVFLYDASIAGIDGDSRDVGINTSANFDLSVTGIANLGAAGGIVSLNKHSFTSSSTLAGLNVGALAGNPSALVDGDLWYNSSTGNLRFRQNGTSFSVGNILGTTANQQVGFGSSTAQTLSFESDFTYNSTTNGLILGASTNLISLQPATNSIAFGGGTTTYSANGLIASTNITMGTANTFDFDLQSGNDMDILADDAITITSGSNATDHVNITTPSTSAQLNLTTASIRVADDASNPILGTVTLVGGGATVNTNKVTANSIILLTCQVPGGTPGFLRISGRAVGTSFTIQSSNGLDTSTVGYFLIEPF